MVTKELFKVKKFIRAIISIIVIALIIVGGAYYIYFYPKTEVKFIDSNVSINQLEIVKKFIPNNANFSFKNISIDSDVKFSEEEITDLAILAIKDIEEMKGNINGILVDIENNEIKLIINAKYKLIPLEINLSFDCRSKDGDAVLHYKKGNIGFISISKERIFKGIKENKWIKIDKENGEIIVTLDAIDGLEITDVKAEKDNVELSIHGEIQFFK